MNACQTPRVFKPHGLSTLASLVALAPSPKMDQHPLTTNMCKTPSGVNKVQRNAKHDINNNFRVYDIDNFKSFSSEHTEKTLEQMLHGTAINF